MSPSISFLKRDPHFAPLVRKHGTPDLKRKGSAFRALCRAIIYQQLSGKAASTIFARFVALFPGKKFPSSEDVRRMPIKKLRGAGISAQKASYLKDLAEKFATGAVKHHTLHRMKSEEIVEHLTQIKGIGTWTVHMFLIFTLARPDVLPTGDLGIRKGFQIIYRLRTLPDHAQMEQLAKPWRAHASAASWYLWRAADEQKTKKPRG